MKVFASQAASFRPNLLIKKSLLWAVLATAVPSAAFVAPAPRASAQVASERSPGERSTPINAVPEKREQEQDEDAQYRHSASVVKLGSMLGMGPDVAATAFTVLNFLALAAGIGFLALKLLPKAFRQRGTEIQKGLVEAKTATEEAGSRLKAVEARLSRLDEEIAAMRRQAEADTVREEHRIDASVEADVSKIVSAAEAEIKAATAAARRELQEHAANLAVEGAARRLEINAETDRLLVRGFADRLLAAKGGQN